MSKKLTLLEKCVDQNVLVFDFDAIAGKFTDKLYSLAKTVLINSPNTFGVAKGVIKSIVSDIPLPVDFTQKNNELDFICDPNLLIELKQLGGALQSADEHIVIFIDETDAVIMGSY